MRALSELSKDLLSEKSNKELIALDLLRNSPPKVLRIIKDITNEGLQQYTYN